MTDFEFRASVNEATFDRLLKHMRDADLGDVIDRALAALDAQSDAERTCCLINRDLLAEAIKTLEDWLSASCRDMAPAARAALIADLYEVSLEDVDEDASGGPDGDTSREPDGDDDPVYPYTCLPEAARRDFERHERSAAGQASAGCILEVYGKPLPGDARTSTYCRRCRLVVTVRRENLCPQARQETPGSRSDNP